MLNATFDYSCRICSVVIFGIRLSFDLENAALKIRVTKDDIVVIGPGKARFSRGN